MVINQFDPQNTERKAKEQVNTALAKLQLLKGQVANLRFECEELRKLHSKKPKQTVACTECKRPINNGQEVIVKDSNGKERSYYHKECFRALWR